MKASLVISVISLVTFAGSAVAQTMQNPRFHSWNWRHPVGATVDARLKAIVQVDCYGFGFGPNGPFIDNLNPNTPAGQTVDPRAAITKSAKVLTRGIV